MLKLLLTSDEGQHAEVATIQLENVERVEVRRTAAIHERFEIASAIGIEAYDFTVENGVNLQAACNVFTEVDESLVRVPRAGD